MVSERWQQAMGITPTMCIVVDAAELRVIHGREMHGFPPRGGREGEGITRVNNMGRFVEDNSRSNVKSDMPT